MGRTFAPVPPKCKPRSAINASASLIFSKGIPTISAASLEVTITLPFPNFSAHSAIARSSAGVKSPATVTILPEKHSVPLLRRKPLPFTLVICSFVMLIAFSPYMNFERVFGTRRIYSRLPCRHKVGIHRPRYECQSHLPKR